MRLIQLIKDSERRVGVVEGEQVRLVAGDASNSVYELALHALREQRPLTEAVSGAIGTQVLDYQPILEGLSEWRLLPSFDHPTDAAHCLVTGTGLTHKASAENRAAMHKKTGAEITDSIRMYQMGFEGGNPAPGTIGVQPEWFYKGNGSVLRGHGQALEVPAYALDGGEEPEIAGVYLISPGGQPFRVGLTVANEFSDHRMEKINYLYLAPSKLRNCAIGPELTIGDVPFDDVPGKVSIIRADKPIWQKEISTGQKNMSYSVSNLEHHHFKYEGHRTPGDVHIHFFGADAFSFGAGLELEEGDVMEVSFPIFGKPLRNTLKISKPPEAFIPVKPL